MEPIIVNGNLMETGLLDAMVEGALDGLCLLTADGVILRPIASRSRCST